MKYFSIYILVACIIVFILQSIFPEITENFALNSSQAIERPYLLITHIFLHGGVEHLFYNMFALFMFGLILEKIIGNKKFLILYFVSGIIAGLFSAFFYSSSLGASGAIFGIMGCLAALRPKMTVWVAYVPMPMIVAAGVWAAIDLFGIFFPSNIANAAHLAGLGAGILAGLYLRKNCREENQIRNVEYISEGRLRRWEDRWM